MYQNLHFSNHNSWSAFLKYITNTQFCACIFWSAFFCVCIFWSTFLPKSKKSEKLIFLEKMQDFCGSQSFLNKTLRSTFFPDVIHIFFLHFPRKNAGFLWITFKNSMFFQFFGDPHFSQMWSTFFSAFSSKKCRIFVDHLQKLDVFSIFWWSTFFPDGSTFFFLHFPRKNAGFLWITIFSRKMQEKKCGSQNVDQIFHSKKKKNADQKMQTQKNADQKMQEQNCVFAIFLKNADPNNTKKDWTSQTRLILRLLKLTNNEHFDTDKMAASC